MLVQRDRMTIHFRENMMNKKVLSVVVAGLIALGGVAFLNTKPAEADITKPNILFILVDDMRKDEMAPLTFVNDGTWLDFSNASVEVPMCCPSRASILTGRYASDVGVTSNTSGQYLDDSKTIATVLDTSGYYTGLAGKYLNNYPWDRGASYTPPGWDYWRAVGSAAREAESKGYYSADYLGVAAKNFIDAKPSTQPFFFYMSFSQPHLPANPAKRHETAPVTLAPWPQNFNEADVSDKSRAVQQMPLATQTTIDQWTAERTAKARSLMSVNDNVNATLNHLRSKGMLDNTIIVFTSDNGYGFGSHRVESKAFPYEELTSMPFYVRMPDAVGKKINTQISFVDLAPTFADLAGTTMPQTRGLSIKPLLTNTATTLNRKWVFMEGPERANAWQAVKNEKYKYIKFSNGFVEFYDLTKDPFEMNSVAKNSAYSAQLTEAAAALNALKP